MTRHHQLKNEARRAEQRADWARAIELYKSAVRLEDERGSGVDVGVYNRIGDLYLRQGDTKAAVEYYEQAADLYSEHGLHTSAIALCNKILRIAPDRDEVYGRLARLHAANGLMAEARSAFLKFAQRMRETDRLSDALEAIQDLVSLTGDEELRTAFADQLVDAGLAAQAVAQLRLVYQARVSGGRNAQDIRERILDLDPDADPVREATRPPARARTTPEPPEADLSEVDLSEVDLSEVDLPETDLPETDLPEADLSDGTFDVRPVETDPLLPTAETGESADRDDATSTGGTELGPDMRDVLARFRSQVEEAVDDADHAVHYDLGVAYMDMGLIEDAVVELGVAARSPELEASARALLEQCRESTPAGEITGEESEDADERSPLPIATEAADVSTPEPDAPSTEPAPGDPVEPVPGDEEELADMLFQARLAQHRVRSAADEGRTDHAAHLDLGRTYERMGLVTEAVGDLTIAAGGAPATREEALQALERVSAVEGIAAPALREALLRLLEHGHESVATRLGREFLNRPGVPEKDRQVIADLFPEPASADTPPDETGERETGVPTAGLPDASPHDATPGARDGSGPAADEVSYGLDSVRPAEPEDEAVALMGEAEGLRSAGRMDEAEAHYYRALELFEKRRDAVNAIRAVDRLLGLRPDDVVLHHQKNEFAIMLNDRELLVSSYLDLAACLRRQNGLRSARTVYGRILDIDPGNAEARAGIAAVDADELARERRRRQRLEPVPPASKTAAPSRGRQELQLIPTAEIDDLFDDLREGEEPAPSEGPPDYDSHFELGVAFQQMEMWEEAARELEIAVRGMDDSIPAYELLGKSLLSLRRYDEACRALTAAADQPVSEERKVGVIFLLGIAHLRGGDGSEARSTLERVLRIDPSHAEAARLLSTLPA